MNRLLLTRSQARTALVVILVIILSAWLVPVGCQVFSRFRFNSEISHVLEGQIVSIRFKPQGDRDFVTITDPDRLADIQRWLAASEAPSLASWPGAICPMETKTVDGTVTKFQMSATGKTKTYVAELREPERLRVPSYVILKHGSWFRIIRDQPFTPYLRATGQIESAKPDPIPMYGDGATE